MIAILGIYPNRCKQPSPNPFSGIFGTMFENESKEDSLLPTCDVKLLSHKLFTSTQEADQWIKEVLQPMMDKELINYIKSTINDAKKYPNLHGGNIELVEDSIKEDKPLKAMSYIYIEVPVGNVYVPKITLEEFNTLKGD